MGFLDWLSLLSFAWLRRCKACGARGSRCVCKRPSLALEHIFFLEERKNKLGARNFSHVSDTMMTAGTNSSLLTASTFSGGFSTVALPNGGQVVTSGNGTVLMGGGADSISDCASVDYIYPAQSFASSHSSGQQQVVSSRSLGHGHSHHHRHHRRSRREEREPASTALVTKSSASAGRFTSKDKIGGRHVVRFEELPPNEMVVAGSNAGGRNWRPQHPPPPPPRQPPQQRAAPFRAENPLLSRDKQQQQQQGCSFQFYGRGGSGQGSSYVSNGYAANGYTGNGGYASTSSSGGYASTDSLALRPSVQSTASFSSDRMSVDNNFGSYNPRGGRLLEGGGGAGYAPSIQEDDEALQRLDGWLHASPTSTADSFAMSRPMY